MKWGNIVVLTGVFVLLLSDPATSQNWVDIKDPKELRALHSNKTFNRTYSGVPVVEHYRADGRGLVVSAQLRMPCTWEVKGNDEVCIRDERGKSCWKYQRNRKKPEEYVRRNPEADMHVLIVQDGIPDF